MNRFSRHALAPLLLLPVLVQAAAPIALDAAAQAAFGIELVAPEAVEHSLGRRYPAEVRVPNPQLRVVAARQDGVLERLAVAEGDRVAAGDLLAELRSPALVDIQRQYLEALIRLELAEGELARDRQLHREGVIAERRLREREATQRELATQVEQQRQLLRLAGFAETELAELDRNHTLTSTLSVRAPISGVVLEQLVDTGESVAQAAPLYRIGQLDPLWLEIHVPLDELDGLAPGSRVHLPALAREAVITTVGRQVHALDQGVLVRAAINDPGTELRPGQFIEVQLARATGAGWRLPAAALVRDGDTTLVFVARDGGFAPQPVELLGATDDQVVVGGALGADDRVAVTGVIAIKAAWQGGE
ncbi:MULTISPECIES: efflux RND transporter periplasmic adaptor subunit [Marichromatium]|uniref:RND family efflux transporter MFP subunit n=1 Tax=Marichromatium gracile TaxID=1048 RepID=A0A4R4AKJ7_MARGR|nr:MULTISPECIES: efflux RND transporter periplasmic adaptor subunit [Marichromatium]MBO8087112.1 efflux RND transporter periplasmic adaptor subunit [Marichromatium sp.]MBK1707596.1 efflux transporter periplasmic adaptor subunit [Marichromatium gracile]RNE90897.1 efflux RND transporter periplasmic adaptor subunit [Marichromatium sp. AB32]RNE91928.1 efflux RND transporter periplasmic adaptor subunit [Marichromatium sp. AB31]TCW39947.1 RND family efflux transporter MFP subunit [Marichromatium gra